MGLEDIDLDVAVAAAMEARRKRSSLINCRGRAKDRRKPGEFRRAQDAITSFCSECITLYGLDVGGAGSVLNAIKECTCQECHLWPWRTGKLEV